MNAGTWMTTAAGTLLVLASCSGTKTPDAREEARGRWNAVRGQLKCQIAAEQIAKGQFDEAQEHLSEALGLNPEEPRAYVLMARVLLERGETASAADMLDQAIRHGGDTAETHYLSGLIAQRYARFTDALASYQQASGLDPTNAHYVAAVAETLVALGRVADALALVRERWTDFEQNATLRSLAGEIYMMLGRYESASAAFREATIIAPDDRVLQVQLGLALALAHRHTEAKAVLSAVAAADEEVSPTVLASLARCHLALGGYEEAKIIGRRVVEANPHGAAGWSLLGQAALGADDLITARRAAIRTVQLEPASTDHAMLLAYVCWRQRDYPAAITSLETVLGDRPDDLIALYLLGQSHRAAGNEGAAEDCHRRALRVNPQCEWARRFLENGSAAVEPGITPWPSPGGTARSP